ncbi:DUF4352 domain-containing protein [Paenibacillus sp. F411]|uniref:DUF4352 domain-containing protein n=1 Tax=Paenibacillus algicola TaxID=2565926 RepID=A0A4P8XI71_9BACL|nr:MULTISPECIES: DUF4352 domain-containing protein [Paenibacillus]MBO2944892.1 DUF4352 domain-containing protein [Paenibacillus sp. F411]QCT02282.1 hypothetical protein E6C60_1566 [Paenibacillus algicola]
MDENNDVKFTKKDFAVLGYILLGIAIVTVIMTWISNNNTDRTSVPPALPKTYALNETLIDGAFSYKVTGAERDGQLVTVNVRAVNESDEAKTLYTGTMKLRDDSGRTYDYDTDYLAEGTLNPGIEAEGRITFKVPEDASGLQALVNTDVLGAMYGDGAGYTKVNIGL